MTLYLFDGKGLFDSGVDQIKNGFLKIKLMPKLTCDFTIGKQNLQAVDGFLEIPESFISEGINLIRVRGYKCEMLIRSGDNITPMGFSTRELVKIAYEVDFLKKQIDELKNWKRENTVDLYI